MRLHVYTGLTADSYPKISILPDSAFRQQIVDHLSRLIKTFAESHPNCFVLPLTWRKHKGTLGNCFSIVQPEGNVKLDRLIKRNERVSRIELCRPSGGQSSPDRLFSLLDTSDMSNDIERLSSECLNLSLEAPYLISRLFEWASTKFRCGANRVYVAIRLLRKWRNLDIDIDVDKEIMSFLQRKADTPGLVKERIYHIVSELVRSHSFAVSRYLQQLIAGGAISDHKVNNKDVPTRLEKRIADLFCSRCVRLLRFSCIFLIGGYPSMFGTFGTIFSPEQVSRLMLKFIRLQI